LLRASPGCAPSLAFARSQPRHLAAREVPVVPILYEIGCRV